MAGNKREVVINSLLGVASLVVSAFLIVYLSGESSRYERDATNRAYAYARDAPSQISRDCRSSVSRNPPKCIDETIDAARENQRKEEDLAAQWVTAWWTQVTGSAAVVGVILSAFGVFLVWRTFRATRESNEIARDTAYRQLRAYISPSETTLEYWDHETEPFVYYKVVATIVNSGLTPAVITKKQFMVFLQDGGGSGGGHGPYAEVVAPRAEHHATGDGGTRYGDMELIRFRIGLLFTYTDYLGFEWTETMWWRTGVEGVVPTQDKKTVKLILESHRMGPDRELLLDPKERAEYDAQQEAKRS